MSWHKWLIDWLITPVTYLCFHVHVVLRPDTDLPGYDLEGTAYGRVRVTDDSVRAGAREEGLLCDGLAEVRQWRGLVRVGDLYLLSGKVRGVLGVCGETQWQINIMIS